MRRVIWKVSLVLFGKMSGETNRVIVYSFSKDFFVCLFN